MKAIKKRVLKTLAVLVPSVVVGGIVSAVVQGENENPQIDINDPNRNQVDQSFSNGDNDIVEATTKAIGDMGGIENVSQNRMKSELRFDSSLQSRIVFSSVVQPPVIRDTSATISKEASDRITKLINDFLDSGMTVSDMALLLAVFRVDYEDSFNVDTRSWTDFLADKYKVTFPSWLTLSDTLRRFAARLLTAALGAYKTVFTIYKFNPVALYGEAERIIRRYKNPTARRARRAMRTLYTSSVKRTLSEWSAAKYGYDIPDIPLNPVVYDDVLKEVRDYVSGKRSVRPDAGEWFTANESEEYDKALREKRYKKTVGVFLDPAYKPSTIHDFVKQNDVFNKISSGDIGVLNEILDRIAKEKADKKSRVLGVIENIGFSTEGFTDPISEFKSREEVVRNRIFREGGEWLTEESAEDFQELAKKRLEHARNRLKTPMLRRKTMSADEIKLEILKLKQELIKTEGEIDTFKKLSSGFQTLPGLNENLQSSFNYLSKINKEIKKLNIYTTLSEVEDDLFDPAAVVKANQQLRNIPQTEEFGRKLAELKKSRLGGDQNVVFKRHVIDNKIDGQLLDNAISSLEQLSLTDNELDALSLQLQSENLFKGAKPDAYKKYLNKINGEKAIYKARLQGVLQTQLKKYQKLQQLQDLFIRAQRRDTIFELYAQLKTAIGRANNEAEVVAALRKYITFVEDATEDPVFKAVDDKAPFDYKSKVDKILKKSIDNPTRNLNTVDFTNATVVNAHKIKEIRKQVDSFVTAASSNLPDLAEILTRYATEVEVSSKNIETIFLGYDKAIAELDALEVGDVNLYRKARVKIQNRALQEVFKNEQVKHFFQTFYEQGTKLGSIPFEKITTMSELKQAYGIAADNAKFALEKAELAGKTLVRRYNDITSQKLFDAQVTLDKLEQMVASETALVRKEGLIGMDLIDVINSPEGNDFKALLTQLSVDVSEAFDEVNVFNDAFDNGVFEPATSFMEKSTTNQELLRRIENLKKERTSMKDVAGILVSGQKNLLDNFKYLAMFSEQAIPVVPSSVFDYVSNLEEVIPTVSVDINRARTQKVRIVEELTNQIEVNTNFKQKFEKLRLKGQKDGGKEFLKVDLDSDHARLLQKQVQVVYPGDSEYERLARENALDGKFNLEVIEHTEKKLDATKKRIENAFGNKAFTQSGYVGSIPTHLEEIKNEYVKNINDAKALEDTWIDATGNVDNTKLTQYRRKMARAEQALRDYFDVMEKNKQNFNLFNRVVQEGMDEGILTGKGKLLQLGELDPDTVPNEIWDFFANNKENAASELLRNPLPESYYQKYRQVLESGARKDVVEYLKNAQTGDKRAKLLTQLNVLDEQVETFSLTLNRIFDWGKTNLANLKSRRNHELLKYNLELLKPNPDPDKLRNLANVIQGVNESILERHLAFLRLEGDNKKVADVINEEAVHMQASMENYEFSDIDQAYQRYEDAFDGAAGSADTGDLRPKLTKEEYTRIFGNPEPVLDAPSTVTKFDQTLKALNDDIQSLKQYVTQNSLNYQNNIFAYGRRRDAILSNLEKLQAMAGDLSATALGTFEDVKSYTASRWFAEGTDDVGNLIEADQAGKKAFSEMQSRYGALEAMSESFQKVFNDIDTAALKTLPLSRRQLVKQVLTAPKIDNSFKKGVEAGASLAKKVSRTADWIDGFRKFNNKALKIADYLEWVEKTKLAVKIGGTKFTLANKLTNVLDPVGSLIFNYGLPWIAKGISKVSSAYAARRVSTVYDSVKGLEASAQVTESFDALLAVQKKAAKWEAGIDSAKDSIKKLETLIEEGGEQGKDVAELKKTLATQKEKLAELSEKIGSAKELAKDAVDGYKKSFDTVFESTEKRLKDRLADLRNVDASVDNTKEIAKIQNQLDELSDFQSRFADLSFKEKIQELRKAKKSGSNLLKGIKKVVSSDAKKLVKKALEASDKAELVLTDTYEAYDKLRRSFEKAKKANKLTSDMIENMDLMKDSVRIARKNAKAFRESLFLARKVSADITSVFPAISKAFAGIRKTFSAFLKGAQSLKALRVILKVTKAVFSAVRGVAKVAQAIPFIGDVLEVVMFAVTVYFLVQRKKAHDKTVAWNKEARKWRAEQELNPWAPTPTDNKEWDKYHPWAIGALPRPLNLGFTRGLEFAKNVENISEHPFLGCEGGDGVPEGKFTYPLISKDFYDDYKNVYSKSMYNQIDVDDWSTWMDLMDPITLGANAAIGKSVLVEEVYDEMWKETHIASNLISLVHDVWNENDATRKEDAYTYPVVNKDCYAFMGKYAPVKDKDFNNDYTDRVGLYEVSEKTRKAWVDDGADPKVIERLAKKEDDYYTAASVSSFEFNTLREVTDFFYDNNQEGFIITEALDSDIQAIKAWGEQGKKSEEKGFGRANDYYLRHMFQANLDPDKKTPDNLRTYALEEGTTLSFKKVKELTKDEFYTVVSEFYYKFDDDPRTYYMDGAFYKMNASDPYNTMESEQVNPSKFRNFRYIYTDSGQEYIDKKTREIIAYNVEQIARTLIEIKKKIYTKLKNSSEFKKRLEKIIAFSSNGVRKELSPVGIEKLLKALEEAKQIQLLYDFDWDLHLTDFKYWQIKGDTNLNYNAEEGENVAVTSFKNMALLADDDPQNIHPWDKLVADNMDDLLERIGSILYDSTASLGIMDITDTLNYRTDLQIKTMLEVLIQTNKGRIAANIDIIKKRAIAASRKYGINAEYDPYNVIPYAVAKTVQLFGATTTPDDLVVDQILDVIISERLRYLIQDLKPPASVQEKLLQAKTVAQVHNITKEFIDNATEKEKHSNFYFLAQILMQTYNWNADNDDDLLGGRTDYYGEMMKNAGLDKLNTGDDRILIERIIQRLKDGGIELSDDQYIFLHSTTDNLRVFVKNWISDFGIFQDVDEFVDSIYAYREKKTYDDTFAVKYTENQRFSRGGKRSFAAQQWGDVSKAYDDSRYKIAAPGPTRLVSLAKFYNSLETDVDQKSLTSVQLQGLYRKLKNFQEDTFTISSEKQESAQKEYFTKTLDVAWDVLEKMFVDKSESEKKGFLLAEKGSQTYNSLKQDILKESHEFWKNAFETEILAEQNDLESLFSTFNNKNKKIGSLMDFVYATDINDFKSLLKGRDPKAINARIIHWDFVPDLLAKVIDLGNVYPELIKRLKKDAFDLNFTDIIKKAPILATYGIILKTIREKIQDELNVRISDLFDSNENLSSLQSEKKARVLNALMNNVEIVNSSEETDYLTRIELHFPDGSIKGLETLDGFESGEAASWSRAWVDQSRVKREASVEQVAANVNNGLTEATFAATMNLAKEIANANAQYQIVDDYYAQAQVSAPTEDEMKTFYETNILHTEVGKGYEPGDIEALTDAEKRLVKAFLYISQHIDYSEGIKNIEGETDPDLMINGKVVINNVEDLKARIGEVTEAIREFVIEKLKKLGIEIRTPSEAAQIHEKTLNRTITITENQYLDTTYVAFLNRYRNDALAQNDIINRVIDRVANDELVNYRNDILDENSKNNILYFKKSDLSKTYIEYIWIDLSERKEALFEENLKSFIMYYTGRNIISDRILDLTKWQATQDSWAAALTKDLLDGQIDNTVTPFSQENVLNYVNNEFKSEFHQLMKEIYEVVKEDTLDYDPSFTDKGIDAFNTIVRALGRLNNEFNNLLLKKILAILGLEFNSNSIAKAQHILPLYIDTFNHEVYNIMTDSLGRDLSPLLSINNYVSDAEGNVIIATNDRATYIAAIDTKFKEYIEKTFQDYMTVAAISRYYVIDRGEMYKDILALVAQGYRRYVVNEMKADNLLKVLSGDVFMDNIKKHVTITALSNVFAKYAKPVAENIGDTNALTNDAWQNYVKDSLFPEFIYATLVEPSAINTPWYFTRAGLPAINILINKGIDQAINHFNSNQEPDDNGVYYSVDKGALSNDEVKEITSDLLMSSLDTFKDLLIRANKENDASLLPNVEEYAYTMVLNFYNDVNTPEKWNGALNKHRFRSEQLLKTRDFSDLESLTPKEKQNLEYESLIILQKTLYARPESIQDPKVLEDLYNKYSNYLEQFIN